MSMLIDEGIVEEYPDPIDPIVIDDSDCNEINVNTREITVHDNKFHHAESAVFIHANLLYVFKKKFVKKFSFMLWEINDDLLYDVMSVLVAD